FDSMQLLIAHFVDLLFSSNLFFFLFTATPTTPIYTLSLHDALPISFLCGIISRYIRDLFLLYIVSAGKKSPSKPVPSLFLADKRDRKSTRLNSSHVSISYAVFCLKKKQTIAILPLLNQT